MKRILFYLKRKKNKEKKKKKEGQWWARGRKKKEFVLVNGPHDFQLIYRKTILQHYLKNKNWYEWVFKIHVLNTFDKKLLPNPFFFFGVQSFWCVDIENVVWDCISNKPISCIDYLKKVKILDLTNPQIILNP